ncbi:hypothetical protein TIFTF001_052699 [Ficus carica]|uniref:Uncharacterized protein n=1 Tax=Ficus carica TaxID=3494 RepID=A0AA88JGP2_FICCA|nr:hypothetical protein TIFTF001_052699 [Ficus carica]
MSKHLALLTWLARALTTRHLRPAITGRRHLMLLALVGFGSWFELDRAGAPTTPWQRATVSDLPAIHDAILWRVGAADCEKWNGHHHGKLPRVVPIRTRSGLVHDLGTQVKLKVSLIAHKGLMSKIFAYLPSLGGRPFKVRMSQEFACSPSKFLAYLIKPMSPCLHHMTYIIKQKYLLTKAFKDHQPY